MSNSGIYLLTAALFALSGCYTAKQGAVMLGYLNRAVPLEQLEPEQSEENREFVRLVTDIRSFATEGLGLAASRNYTNYVEIDRNYLAAVVSASARDSFQRHEWSFPIVGKMPYKGFFDIEDARKEAEKLEKKGMDVWIRRVDAFSTLGWFKDPLYSFMRSYPPSRLADLIIHELVHATVFIKGQVTFNEELAEFIGSEGARLYMETRYGTDSPEYRAMLENEANSLKFIAIVQQLIAELEAVYSNTGLSREEKLAEKERVIKETQQRFEVEYENNFSNDNYRGFSQIPINNAFLEIYRIYYTEDNFYAELYERAGRNLPAFIAAAKTITKNGNPREQLENALFPNP
jgi:predicted aminopeptidase